jgi:hypothetical protein
MPQIFVVQTTVDDDQKYSRTTSKHQSIVRQAIGDV